MVVLNGDKMAEQAEELLVEIQKVLAELKQLVMLSGRVEMPRILDQLEVVEDISADEQVLVMVLEQKVEEEEVLDELVASLILHTKALLIDPLLLQMYYMVMVKLLSH